MHKEASMTLKKGTTLERTTQEADVLSKQAVMQHKFLQSVLQNIPLWKFAIVAICLLMQAPGGLSL